MLQDGIGANEISNTSPPSSFPPRSRVLDAVPSLGWGRGRECTFLGALEAALSVTGQPFSYADMMGFTGLAFRTRWWKANEKAKWCPSCAVGEMREEMIAASRATGWELRC